MLQIGEDIVPVLGDDIDLNPGDDIVPVLLFIEASSWNVLPGVNAGLCARVALCIMSFTLKHSVQIGSLHTVCPVLRPNILYRFTDWVCVYRLGPCLYLPPSSMV